MTGARSLTSRTSTGEPDQSGSARRSKGFVRRVGWGVADQGISSLSNFALGIIVARSMGPEQLGAFTLAYVTFGFVLSASRGTSTDPLLVRFSGPESPAWRRAVSAATATAMATGVLCGLLCLVLGLLLPGDLGTAFIALGIGLPGILLQDSYRFAFFSCGRGERAFVNDLLWGVLQILALFWLLWTGHLTVFTSLLAFGVTATLAAGIGMAQCRIAPRPRLVRPWLVDHKDLGGRYLIENVSVGGARQVRMTVVGILAGLSAVGAIRAAEILMGPFLVLLSGVSQVAVPEAKKVLLRVPTRLGRFCFWLSAVQASAAALWGVIAYTLFPLGFGVLLLGANWSPAEPLLVPLAITLVVGCFEIGATAGLRALGAARRSLSAQLVSAALYVAGGTIGAAIDGALGSCWGVAIATLLGALLRWYHLRKASAAHLAAEEPVLATAR
jgi:O-antigen/teichoic acid export membrane protein